MSSKLIRKSLQQSLDHKKSDNCNLHETTPHNSIKSSEHETNTKITQEKLIQIQVQSILKFDKYSSRRKSAQRRIIETRMKSIKLAKRNRRKVNDKIYEPYGMIVNSRSSSSAYNADSVKAPKTVTKQGAKKERERVAMHNLVKQLRKHQEKKSLAKSKK